MRPFVAASICLAMLASACTSSETVNMIGEQGSELPFGANDPVDTTSETTTASTPTTAAPEDLPVDPANYLLQSEELPGWEYGRAMDFAAEPTFEVVNCDLMDTAWSAHGMAGTRIRASANGASFRQTVVEMPDEASAVAIIDAAEAVWLECNPLTNASGGGWWVEPVQVPEVEGWRTAGLALGGDGGLIWAISWFQQGTTVVFIDLDSESPWSTLDPVQQAVAARLTGETANAPAPTATTTPGTAPPKSAKPRPEQLPPPTTQPAKPTKPTTSTTERQRWQDHPAAVFVPDADFFGPGFEFDYAIIEEESPSDPDDVIDGCAVVPPPTMDGVKAEYEHEPGRAQAEVVIGINHAQWAQDIVDAFRDLGDCDADLLGVDSIVVSNPESDADDVVVLDVYAGVSEMHALLLIARYGDMSLSLFFAVEGDSDLETPTVETITRWADEIVAQG